ncbi:MAG TPA: hypothetical protein DDW52_27355 [Planctomycetaceae bacterium]|nr:hypothetical protein [Planctomycetaceae bacterium]
MKKSRASLGLLSQLRRFLLFHSLALAFGGFLFYAAVVVPTGSDIVGVTTQGFVTQQVTNVLNLLVVWAVVMLGWEYVAQSKQRSVSANRILLFSTCTIGLSVCLLFWLHQRLDGMLDADLMEVSDSSLFYLLHRFYLWVCTIQWMCSLMATWIVLLPPTSETVSAAGVGEQAP